MIAWIFFNFWVQHYTRIDLFQEGPLQKYFCLATATQKPNKHLSSTCQITAFRSMLHYSDLAYFLASDVKIWPLNRYARWWAKNCLPWWCLRTCGGHAQLEWCSVDIQRFCAKKHDLEVHPCNSFDMLMDQDDVRLVEGFSQKLLKLMDELPKDWEAFPAACGRTNLEGLISRRGKH